MKFNSTQYTIHSSESTLTELQTNGINKRLLEFHENSSEMLLSSDRHIIDYPIGEVIKWTLDRKKATLDNLEILHKLMIAKMTRAGLGVHDIADYFQRPEIDE